MSTMCSFEWVGVGLERCGMNKWFGRFIAGISVVILRREVFNVIIVVW